MRRARPHQLVSMLAILAGCATTPPVPPPDHFVRVRRVDGCWTHVDPREYNIALGTDLERILRAQLPGKELELPQCWYEQQSGEILFMAGEPCVGYDEFKFQKAEGTWKLVYAKRQELVMCHERRTD